MYGDDVWVLEQRGEPGFANEGVEEQVAGVVVEAGHGDVAVALAIENFEDALHAADGDLFGIDIALLQPAQVGIKRRMRLGVALLECLVEERVQGLILCFRRGHARSSS